MALPPESYLTVFVESAELLRKPNTPKQRQRFGRQESAFKSAVREQAADLGFVPLSGSVSVHLHVHAPEQGNQPLLPPVAKAYLDGLQCIAYTDDRQVEHLIVRQDVTSHPMMDNYTPEDAEFVGASVFIEVEPVQDYTARYDRAFRATWWRRGPSPWRRTWTLRKEARLQRLRAERQRLPREDNQPLEQLVRSLEEERLRDGVLADIDRPGPLPAVTRALHRVLPAHRIHWYARRRSGAAFVLPLRGEQPGSGDDWSQALEGALQDFHDTQPGLPFNGFVALDIAVRGTSLHGKDLDNLAHSILGPFEDKLCVRRGTVVDYRVYTTEGEPQGLQVRVIDHARLLSLDIALSEMRTRIPLDRRLRRWSERKRASLPGKAS